MAKILSPADIENAIRALVSAEKSNLGIEVTVPVAYGDGELVSVVVEQDDSGFVVHDAGFSAMRLSSAGIPLSRGIVHRMTELASRYRATFADGRVTANASADDLAQVVALVANAARSVADYIYEVRRQAESEFRVVVFDKLREIIGGDRVRDTDEFRGKSGRRYRVPIILDVTKTRAQNFVSTLAQRHAVPQNVSMFLDLGGAYPDIERDAVYDDAADLRQEDRSLLELAGAAVFGWDHFREFIHNVQRH